MGNLLVYLFYNLFSQIILRSIYLWRTGISL